MTVIPPYLEAVLNEATDYYESDDSITASIAGYEIAHENESLVRMDEGDRDTFTVLKDLHQLNTLCGDEFETYRSYRNAPYADSILEALALRSLEEFITTYLSEEASFDVSEPNKNREIEYINTDTSGPEPSFINIHVKAKEAVDIENALQALIKSLEEQHPKHSQAEQYNRLWEGGVSGLSDTSFILTSASDATILLEALARYEPQETDYTARLRHAILEATKAPESPIDPNDVETASEDIQPPTAD